MGSSGWHRVAGFLDSWFPPSLCKSSLLGWYGRMGRQIPVCKGAREMYLHQSSLEMKEFGSLKNKHNFIQAKRSWVLYDVPHMIRPSF